MILQVSLELLNVIWTDEKPNNLDGIYYDSFFLVLSLMKNTKKGHL